MVYHWYSFLLYPYYGEFIALNQYTMSPDECKWNTTLFIPLGRNINSVCKTAEFALFDCVLHIDPWCVLYRLICTRRLSDTEHACNRKVKTLCHCLKITAFQSMAVHYDASVNRTFNNYLKRLKTKYVFPLKPRLKQSVIQTLQTRL